MHKNSQDVNNRKGIIAFQAELRKELKDGDGHAFGQKASIYKQTIQDIDSVSSWSKGDFGLSFSSTEYFMIFSGLLEIPHVQNQPHSLLPILSNN